MKESTKAIKFVICFIFLCYLGGAALMLGAHQSAKLIGVSVVIAIDEDAGGVQ